MLRWIHLSTGKRRATEGFQLLTGRLPLHDPDADDVPATDEPEWSDDTASDQTLDMEAVGYTRQPEGSDREPGLAGLGSSGSGRDWIPPADDDDDEPEEPI